VTRGSADRDFLWEEGMTPTLVLFTQAKEITRSALAERGARVIAVEDKRWKRRDIKTVQLLWPSMAKMEAKRRGKDDAWLVEDGLVTEGTSNNAWIVAPGGVLVTRHLSSDILHGITRASVMRYAREAGMRVEERPFALEEARAAEEAFITSASAFVTPVVEIDGEPVGQGTPGPVARRLRDIYIEESRARGI
ncbi:MAG: aminotransferase class IV, partial [Pseudomonadota bacterium]